MLDPKNTRIILGPPGTGKTTRLLDEVAALMKTGVDPKRIAFLAFTRKAAAEARNRAMARFAVTEKELEWFRTIHSVAFRQTGSSGNRLLKKIDYKKMADEIGGFEYRGEGLEEEIVAGVEGDALFFLNNMSRVTEKTLDAVWQRKIDRKIAKDDLTFEDLERTKDVVARYKNRTGLIDHTDPLEIFASSGLPPSIDYLLVDEAQDLSRLQWRVIERIAPRAKKTIVAGDDDQAVFGWAGADVETFLDLDGEVVVLDGTGHSRLPRVVHALAVKVSERLSRRRPKNFVPKKDEGEIELLSDEREVDAARGTWLFLARHVFQLGAFEDLCREEGWFYERGGEASNQTDAALAVLCWENLRRGAEVTVSEVQNLVSFVPKDSFAERGLRRMVEARRPEDRVSRTGDQPLSPWTEALTGVPDEDHRYFRLARQNGEKLAVLDKIANRFEPATPRIIISTIHGAKGGEADGVLLSTDISESTAAGMEIDADDEHRVFYVGATRAKERLAIRRPRTAMNYPLTELVED